MFADYVKNNYIERNRQHALSTYPDRIRVSRPTSGDFTVNDQGTVIPGAPAYIEWQGDSIIPCRFDNSRSFRPDALRAQEVVANEHILHVPIGVDIRPDDKISLLTPVELTQNANFADGFTGWTGATSGATYQELVLGGAQAVFTDLSTELLGQTVGTGLSGELLTVSLWAEVVAGTVRLTTPIGNVTLNAGENQRYQLTGTHAGVENDIFLIALAQPATVVVAKFQAHRYRTQRIFEARKFTNASEYDVSNEILVTEMEFQHTDD